MILILIVYQIISHNKSVLQIVEGEKKMKKYHYTYIGKAQKKLLFVNFETPSFDYSLVEDSFNQEILNALCMSI